MPPTEKSPTVRGRRLARELRNAREAAGLTPAQVAAAVGFSRPKLVAIETAKQGPKIKEVEDLLALYGCDATVRLKVLELARTRDQRGWWASYSDVVDGSLPELESDAALIKAWQPLVIPGLLQTDYYAKTLFKISNPSGTEESHNRQLAARAVRRTVLIREKPPEYHAIIDESVLKTSTGGPEVMKEQLEYLIAAAKRPNITIRVVRQDVWDHPGKEGPFVILGFDGELELDVVYLEGPRGTRAYLEDAHQVAGSNVNFGRIANAALDEDDSIALIRDLAIA